MKLSNCNVLSESYAPIIRRNRQEMFKSSCSIATSNKVLYRIPNCHVVFYWNSNCKIQCATRTVLLSSNQIKFCFLDMVHEDTGVISIVIGTA